MSEEEERLTNQKFSDSNEGFQSACAAVDLKPTSRQASKWRNKKGKAYKAAHFQARRITLSS